MKDFLPLLRCSGAKLRDAVPQPNCDFWLCPSRSQSAQGHRRKYLESSRKPWRKTLRIYIFLGAAVIVRPPENQTVLENSEVRIPCEGQAEPANLTVRWYKDGIPYNKMANLEKKAKILSDGTLQIALITAEDSGWYTCEITNGIGKSITERAYINVECK